MSVSLEQIMADARLLQARLTERGKIGEALHFEVDALNKKLDSMKMLQEDTESLNKMGRGRTNNQMLAVINNENPNYREIQQENRELKACLEDYQRTIELVMTKFRQHAQDKIVNNKLVLPDIYNQQKDEIIQRQEARIKEMMAVMRKASTLDDENVNKESERLVQLIKENEGLRELLQISRQYGSVSTYGADDGDHEITQIENLKREKDADTDDDEEED